MKQIIQDLIANVLTALYQPFGCALVLAILIMFLQMFAEAHATRHKKALISLYDEDPLKNWERDW